MKYYTLILIALFPITYLNGLKDNMALETSHPLCHENPVVVDQIKYEDYQVIISSAGDQICRTFDILKNGKLVYHDEEIGGYFYFGDDTDEENDSED